MLSIAQQKCAFGGYVSTEDKERWNRKYNEAPEKWELADPFLPSAYAEFLSDTKPGMALDVGGGAGRHAIWLAQKGWHVRLLDVSDVATGLARQKAAQLADETAGFITAETVDLNTITSLGPKQYELIVVFFFLRRELFPALIQALKPNGMLIYKTYTLEQAKLRGGPGDASYLLHPNELRQAFSTLHVLHYQESVREKATAELVARRT
jgi:tellurite methyltransferase